MSAPLNDALRYSKIGWHVFPVKPDKKPHTEHGFKDASTDEAAIRSWWAKWPNAKVGVACGLSGLVVVDLDIDEEEGLNGLAQLEDLAGPNPTGADLIASSPRGGLHYVFAADGEPYATVNNDPRKGIDVRGAGGYFIAPSAADPGRSWDTGDPFEDVPGPMPAWLSAHLSKSHGDGDASGGDSARVMPIDEAQEAEILDALRHIDSDDRGTWVKVGMALKSTGAQAQAYRIWVEWSKSSSKFDPKVQRQQWASFKEFRRDGSEITLGTLFHLAKQSGYVPAGTGSADDPMVRAFLANEAAKKREAGKRGVGRSPLEVLAAMREQGPTDYVPTGLASFDAAIGGGIPYPSRIGLQAPPDLGKTGLGIQVCESQAAAGMVVGVLAVDEDAEDVLQRYLQRRGWPRRDVEKRAPEALDAMGERLRDIDEVVRFFGADDSIDDAAAELHKLAEARGTRAFLFIDSVQTARSNAARKAEREGMKAVVDANVRAIRDAARRYRMAILATSEVSRGAYRSKDRRMQTADVAASKESGSIEYQMRILASLRAVDGDDGLVEIRFAKNKHGSGCTRQNEPGVFVRLDRASQTFTEERHDVPDVAEQWEQQRLADAGAVVCLIAQEPGCGAVDLEKGLRGTIGKERIGKARKAMEECGAVVVVPGGGTKKHLYVAGSEVPDDVLATVPREHRAMVRGSEPPPDVEPPRETPRDAASRSGGEPPQPPRLLGGGGSTREAQAGTVQSEELARMVEAREAQPQLDKDSWCTPVDILDAARQVLGSIDLDPATNAFAQGRVQADVSYTIDDDGLSKPWRGRVWLNPPYSNPVVGQFVAKLVQHVADGEVTRAILLVNNASSSKWYRQALQHAKRVCLPERRIRFERPDGSGPGNNPAHSQAIFYFGDDPALFERVFSPIGAVTMVAPSGSPAHPEHPDEVARPPSRNALAAAHGGLS